MENNKEKIASPEQNQRIVEKHYIEVNPSARRRFWLNIIGGLGTGIGLTLGTGIVLTLIAYFVSKVNFVPIFGHFLSEVIKSAQGNIYTK